MYFWFEQILKSSCFEAIKLAICYPLLDMLLTVEQFMDPREITTRELLNQAIQEGLQLKYLLFWGHTAKTSGTGKHVLSQWWPSPFEVDGETFPTAEHFMMASKARLFHDEVTRTKILQTSKPGAAKALGRQIARFDQAQWTDNRFGIVVAGNIAKFSQNAELGDYLKETGNKILVEASPTDQVWGIGLAANDPAAQNPANWRGLNLLGFALMKARLEINGL